MTFAALLVTQKRDKKKRFFMILRGRTMFAPTMRVVVELSNMKRCFAQIAKGNPRGFPL